MGAVVPVSHPIGIGHSGKRMLRPYAPTGTKNSKDDDDERAILFLDIIYLSWLLDSEVMYSMLYCTVYLRGVDLSVWHFVMWIYSHIIRIIASSVSSNTFVNILSESCTTFISHSFPRNFLCDFWKVIRSFSWEIAEQYGGMLCVIFLYVVHTFCGQFSEGVLVRINNSHAMWEWLSWFSQEFWDTFTRWTEQWTACPWASTWI